ncbi:hypothetical protein HWV62_13303 [Athelia sp. TMB]|nr:hypothetical protein HWV62_13303 [Athelia sp. TMB]
MSTSNTAGTGAGSGFGNKIKGAIQVTHGIGENIRGTVLGAVDTVSGDNTGADNVATTGRAEVDQGMANMRGTAPPVGDAAGTGVVGNGTFSGVGTGTGPRGAAQNANSVPNTNTTSAGFGNANANTNVAAGTGASNYTGVPSQQGPASGNTAYSQQQGQGGYTAV